PFVGVQHVPTHLSTMWWHHTPPAAPCEVPGDPGHMSREIPDRVQRHLPLALRTPTVPTFRPQGNPSKSTVTPDRRRPSNPILRSTCAGIARDEIACAKHRWHVR